MSSQLGQISIEWAYDGDTVWIVQLSKNAVLSDQKIIFPGEVNRYIRFDVTEGHDALRVIINSIGENNGIELIGNVGITSHFGDVLRNAQIPSKLTTV